MIWCRRFGVLERMRRSLVRAMDSRFQTGVSETPRERHPHVCPVRLTTPRDQTCIHESGMLLLNPSSLLRIHFLFSGRIHTNAHVHTRTTPCHVYIRTSTAPEHRGCIFFVSLSVYDSLRRINDARTRSKCSTHEIVAITCLQSFFFSFSHRLRCRHTCFALESVRKFALRSSSLHGDPP